MRVKITLSLILLNLFAFGLIYFLSQQGDSSIQAKSNLASLIGKEVAEAQRIELFGSALDTPRVLELDGSTWRMTAPMEWSANYFAVNRILNQLQFLEEEASFSLSEIEKTGQTLADFGLDSPALSIRLSSEGQSVTLSIGSLTEIGNNIYILGPDAEEIFVVSGDALKSLLVDLSDLRTREVFDIPVFEVKSMTVQIQPEGTTANGGLKVRLAKTNDDWNFEAPLNAQADPAIVSNTINTLTATKVLRFESEAIEPTQHGLENPFMRVTLDGNKRRQTLLIGNASTPLSKQRTFYAKLENNPTIFTVAARPFEELQSAQEALRERNFMSFDPSTINSISLSEGILQTRLQKLETGEEWQVIESKVEEGVQPYRADPEVMQALLNDLRTLRATNFTYDTPSAADLERLGFNTPRRIVKLSTPDKKETILQLAHPDDENEALYARKTSAEYIYEVDRRSTFNKLPLSALHYRNRTLDALPEAARIGAIKLTDLRTGEDIFNYTLTNPSQLWQAELSGLADKELAATLQLIDSVRKFSVNTYLSNNYTDEYIVDSEKSLPWIYALEAKILLPGGETLREETRRYVFAERLSGTLQAGASKAQNTVFQISQNTLDALYTFTENMPLPPEALSEPVPAPETPEPLGNPPAEAPVATD